MGRFTAACVDREFQTPYLLCDCNLVWLLRWIKARNIAVKSTRCSYPQSLQGQFITSRPELFTCGTDPRTQRGSRAALSLSSELCVSGECLACAAAVDKGQVAREGGAFVCSRSCLISVHGEGLCMFKDVADMSRQPGPETSLPCS